MKFPVCKSWSDEFATISRKEKYVFRPVNLTQLIDDIVALQAPHLAQNSIEIQNFAGSRSAGHEHR